ncbi:CLUMA_CG008383, isoform A [Clunio marinus]|uniref:CLUMA_CG008383, isoform A n=1 Tax=Clunio marinus TaxID=568069 RepID=A0A1J1I3W8_9DIPT|nr:CLUMA_CG008383, isoform A [Clunio marinus]
MKDFALTPTKIMKFLSFILQTDEKQEPKRNYDMHINKAMENNFLLKLIADGDVTRDYVSNEIQFPRHKISLSIN